MRHTLILLLALFGCDADGRRADAGGVCADDPTGTPCNDYGLTFPADCCTAAEHCCHVRFEFCMCLPANDQCPEVCRAGRNGTCPAGQRCVFGVSLDTQGCDPNLERSNCTTACAPDRQCGRECCDVGTVCANGCCMNAPAVDAGLPDAP